MGKRIFFLFLCCCFSFGANGQIVLPRLISDGAVLQRGVELKLWGWASPGEQVILDFNQQSYITQTDQHGNWTIMLPPQQAGGPYQMAFRGNNLIILQNILFGDVWLCSGQSNMELTMQRVADEYPDVIKNANNPFIRQFLVPDKYDFNNAYQDFDAGQWVESSPESIDEFSAVAYFFAQEIHQKYRIPIGLVNAALGGSPVEAWMSEDGLKQFPYAYDELQQFKDENFVSRIEAHDRNRQQTWYKQLNEKDTGLQAGEEWFLEHTADHNWEKMEIPGFWANQTLGDVNGVVWFRKKITVPKSMAGQEAKLWLGRIVDQDHVYVNGEFVGTTGYQYPPRKYKIKAGLLKEGENTIAIRIINEQGRGGFILDKPYFLAIQNDTIHLTGNWKYQLGGKMEPLASPTFIRWKAGGLYKRMIAPLLNYHIKGVIWYQGESNTKKPDQYDNCFPALINDWRDQWKIGDFPFLYVQLANYMEETPSPTESAWAELRQAQLNALSVPNTGMAVAIDIGEWNDIHPLNKKDVGKRLALLARKLAYGEKDLVAQSPTPEDDRFRKKNVVVTFRDTGGQLLTKNGQPLAYFEISADGKKFVKASAAISGKKVKVWQDQIQNPVAIRYAWANNPATANLYAVTGLPASPFQITKTPTQPSKR
ncbi:MAG TPA: sialate O-acetylesterase [Saprospiraceae bacterium]|nr:sialate O-acetylesterase [Saprospiraceae bacterium]HMQ82203.1 sialate O-acetylesterase [Saprospiraceae bacterium]